MKLMRIPASVFSRLFPIVAFAGALAAFPARAVTVITVDAPGCTSGGTLTWDAATKTVYCQGAASAARSSLRITGPDCAAGAALGWTASTLEASCQTSTGAQPASSLQVGVALPDCVAGTVTWSASTRTLTCAPITQWLDVDASTSGAYDALTDGLLVMRYLLGIRGTALTNNALSSTALRTNPAAIAAYLDSIRASLDVDSNGVVDAATDGTLILRYMFGTRGAALVNGAVGVGANPGTPAAIEAKLQALMP
jgi:hypothetical protein